MDTSFIQKLRLNNLFPVDNKTGSTAQDYGMPDMNSGNDVDLNQMLNTIRFHRNLRAADDDARDARLNGMHQGKPFGVTVPKTGQDDFGRNVTAGTEKAITPFQQAGLDIDKQKLTQTARKQILAEKIASGKATDEEKNEYQLGQIEARGDESEQLQGIRGSQAIEQIGARIAGQTGINDANIASREKIAGENLAGRKDANDANIAGRESLNNASIAGRQSLQDSKPKTEMLPTQVTAQQKNIVNQLMNTRPDLAKFITIDPNTGNPSITAPEDSVEFEQLNKMIYGPNSKDAQLPFTGSKKPEVKRPATAKPDPLGIR